MQFSKTFERTGLIDMPLKSDAVKDLDILPELPFNKRIVQLNPNLSGTIPVSIIKLNNLAKKWADMDDSVVNVLLKDYPGLLPYLFSCYLFDLQQVRH